MKSKEENKSKKILINRLQSISEPRTRENSKPSKKLKDSKRRKNAKSRDSENSKKRQLIDKPKSTL